MFEPLLEILTCSMRFWKRDRPDWIASLKIRPREGTGLGVRAARRRVLLERILSETQVHKLLVTAGKSGKSGNNHSYRSIRGRPNCLNTLLSANHVIAEMWSPSRVSTKSANARATSVSGAGR